jgi:lipoprotein-releasing system permease protein
MNIEFFIAKRIFSDKSNRKSISQTIIRIALAGISLGMIVMILSVAIVTGFKREIRDKVVGFGSNIQLTRQDTNESYQAAPIDTSKCSISELKGIRGVTHIQPYAVKAGIIKTEEDIQGVILKGVGQEFNWQFLHKFLVKGRLPSYISKTRSNEVLISAYLANLLRLDTGQTIITHFIEKTTSLRKFKIVGVYDTGLEIYDKVLIICDIKQIQLLNQWPTNYDTGLEIGIADFNRMNEISDDLWGIVGNQLDKESLPLAISTIRDLKPEIFTWLDLTDMNVVVIIVLMLAVASVNMVSSLLILILERTQMIGILKSVGMTNVSIRKIFLYNAAFLTAKGLFWGNLIGIGLAAIQMLYHVIPLDPASYYLNSVPVNLNISDLVLLNLGSLTAIVCTLIIPSLIVAKISPVKAIEFR